MKTVFDLRQWSSVDLDRLGMAIQSGINDCGDIKALMETKETLYAQRMIVQMAYNQAVEREGEEAAKDILGYHPFF